MHPDKDKRHKIYLFISVVCAISIALIPKPRFDELVHLSGELSGIETKGNGGKIFTLKTRDRELSFIIPNSTRENNEVIKKSKNGDVIDIWYLDRYSLYRGRFEAWQVSIETQLVIAYEEIIEETILYQWFFATLSLVFGGLSLGLHLKKKFGS